MIKEFVPYELALRLKALGFDEPSPTFYTAKGLLYRSVDFNGYTIDKIYSNECLAPTFSQAFRWLRDVHKQHSHISNGLIYSFVIDNKNYEDYPSYGDNWFKTYEEAELACLDKLIQIVKEKL